jgi:hypothetical protein
MNSRAPEAPGANIEMRIERIVLEGLPIQSQDRAAIGAAVESELRRLLAEGVWDAGAASVALPSLCAEAIYWSAANGVNRLGAQIAQAVYSSLAGRVASGENL